MEKLILIDGNSLLFRAYFAMRPMVTSDGLHTQGIYAFINMLNKIIADYSPDYMAVAFDMKEKTFRHDKYSEYKAGRLATPIELLSEIPLMHEVLEAMNIKVVEMPKYEADDLIGTISKRASADGIQTIVISGDKDELQLVDENTNVLINKKGMSEFALYDLAAMKERYNLTPKQFIDLKGLMGDKSDNIPGVPGIGEKKGIALLEAYGSIESVLEHAAEIKGKLGEAIRENIEQAKLSKWLATINRDAPIDFEWDELRFVEPNMKALVEVYTRLEFSSFLKRLNVSEDIKLDAVSSDSFNIEKELARCEQISLGDFILTTDRGSVVNIELITDNNHRASADISKLLVFEQKNGRYAFVENEEISSELIHQLAAKEYKLIAYDIKRVLYSFISIVRTDWIPYFDPTIAEYLLDSNRSKYNLEKMLLRYNGISLAEDELSIFEDKSPMMSSLVDEQKLLKRALYINELRKEQLKALEDKGLYELFEKCEMPLTLTLAEMENEGILVDKNILVDIGNELSEKIASLEKDIYQEAEVEFNINSPKQLGQILFEKLSIPYPKQKSAGAYSTAADVLDKLKYNYPIINNILEYRKLSKLKSTYVDGLIELIADDNRIRPHFMQTVAATGRLSCTEPNLQNIPIRDDYGRLIRKAFITDEGMCFVGSDYSQIELRILAALSGDELLIKAFNEGKDIHRATASSVFNIPFDEVSATERSRAKAVNFGVVYGMSGFGLSENLDISRAEGQKYINDYFNKHTAVKDYLDKQIEIGEQNKEVRTYYGRLRQINDFASRKYMEREAAKRLAMNTPIQGTAADIIKFAMNDVRNELKKRRMRSRLILQIHDELILECPENERKEAEELLETCMSSAADLTVMLSCDVHSGKTWYELK